MLRRRISALVIVLNLVLPALAGCLVASVAQASEMECCAHSVCAQEHRSPGCFSTTAPTSPSQTNPQLRAALTPPSFTASLPLPEGQDARPSGCAGAAEPQEHSPPLYTLHLALLI
jgi:hypothetical protein